jgi:hypothetical protein
MEDGSLELMMMTPTTRANPGCMTSPEVVRGTCRVDVHTCAAKEARLVSFHTRVTPLSKPTDFDTAPFHLRWDSQDTFNVL